MAQYFTSTYAHASFDQAQFARKVQYIAEALRILKERLKYDAVAVRGKSGIAYVFAASLFLNIDILVVRKPGENSHGLEVEGPSDVLIKRYIILDDFIETGDTVRAIMTSIANNEYRNHFDDWSPAECVGVLLYDYEDSVHDPCLVINNMVPVFSVHQVIKE